MPFHVRAENPFDYENPQHIEALDRLMQERFKTDPHMRSPIPDVARGGWMAIESTPIQDALKQLGHDAFFVMEDGYKNLAVYDPTRQLKSATGNLGTFDPEVPRLTEAHGGEVEREHHSGGELVGKALRAVMGSRADKYVADPAQRAENLTKFLSRSQVRNTETGDPIRLYHITPRTDIETLKPGGFDPEISGHATWLSPYPHHLPAAHNVGSTAKPVEGTNVMPVFANIERPLLLDTPDMIDWARTVYDKNLPYLVSKEAREALIKDGYDGIVWGGSNPLEYAKHNLQIGQQPGGEEEILSLFGGRQLKSATGNLGTFDPNIERLTEAHGGKIREHHADGERVTGEVRFDPRELVVPPQFRAIPQDSGFSVSGDGKQRLGEVVNASLVPTINAGPISGGPMLVGVKDFRQPIVGYQASAALPEGFSASYSSSRPLDVPSKYSDDTLSLAKEILGMQVAAQLQKQGDRSGYGVSLSKGDNKGQSYLSVSRPSSGGVAVMGGKAFRFADGGEVYQSTGEKLVDDGKINWGDPNEARDFFRADAEMMRRMKEEEDAKKTTSVLPSGASSYASVGDLRNADPILTAIRGQESSNNVNAQSKTSTSGGLFGFIDSTWVNTLRRMDPQRYGNMSDADLVALKKGPQSAAIQQSAADYHLRADIAPTLSGANIPLTPGNIYLGWFQGPQGAVTANTAPPDARVADLFPKTVGPNADIKFNGKPYAQWTIADLRAWADSKMAKRMGRQDGGQVVEREGHSGGKKVVDAALDAIRAWHGSGKRFKQFDPDKMGSGVGEMYGRGVYATLDPDFARTYRDMGLARRGNPDMKVGRRPVMDLYNEIMSQADKTPVKEASPLYERVGVLEDLLRTGDAPAAREFFKDAEYSPETMKWFETAIAPKLWTPGGLYEVQINASPSQFLNWNMPLREQSPFVQDILRPKAEEISDVANQARASMLARGKDFMGRPHSPERLEHLKKVMSPDEITGQTLYGKAHQERGIISPGVWSPEANAALREQGIVGNAYRDITGTKPTENFVVFDPTQDIEILNRYAHGGEVDDALHIVRESHAGGKAVGKLFDEYLSKLMGYKDAPAKRIADWQWRPLPEVAKDLSLTEIPPHVQDFGKYMREMSEKAAREGLSSRDLIKGYTTTRASIQRRATDADRLRDLGLDLPSDVKTIRPEGAWAEWLMTPMGKRYLDAAAKGTVEGDAVANAIKIMSPFGRHETDIPDSMKWAAQNLPGREKAASDLVARAMQGGSSPEEWRAFTADIRGVGPSKSGFLASLYGRGDQPTLDARQIILNTGAPTKEASRYIARGGGEGGVEAVDRLAARQRALELDLPSEYDPFYQHLAHHAIWDKASNEMTTHDDVVRAMRYAHGGEVDDALHIVREHHAEGQAVGTTSQKDMEAQRALDLANSIRAYERSIREIEAQPEEYRMMTHRPQRPRAPIEVEGGFIGKRQLGTAPYDIARTLSGVAQGAYDLKTLPLYAAGSVFPPAAAAGTAIDVAEGVAAGSPTQVAMGAFGTPGKVVKNVIAPLSLATGALSPDEAQAAKAPKISAPNIVPAARAVTPSVNMSVDDALAILRKTMSEPKTGADPRFWHGISSVKLSRPIDEMKADYVRTDPVFNVPVKTPSDYEGTAFITALGDPSIGGVKLVGINGEPFTNPTVMQAGPAFTYGAAARGPDKAIWASDLSPVSGIANRGRAAYEAGFEPFLNYVKMGAQSPDYSHHVTDPILDILRRSKVSKASVAEFDRKMREGFTKDFPAFSDWPGLSSKNLEGYLFGEGPGKSRTAMAKLMDTAEFKKAGMPDVGAVRFAATDPDLLNVPGYTSGRMIARMDPTATAIREPAVPHKTYATQLSAHPEGADPARFMYDIPFGITHKDFVDKILAEKPKQKPSQLQYTFTRSVPTIFWTPENVDRVSRFMDLKQKGLIP